ncbi:MAG: daunorubicin resistance transporter ATPase subunit [Mycobacterium sp.]|nr:daunorubicin resistance transporter ATPase subunit [Mycobacterium sp.]
MTDAIVVEGLRRTFGRTEALRGVDLRVAQGTVLGLLGPNGAGKTTAVRILATLLHPTSGRASVLGLDCVRDAAALRQRIGLAGQYAAIDEKLTGRENLRMVGRLYHLPRRRSDARADELLERFDLSAAADRVARTYSGGMRRRLDLAASLVNAPEVLFLDEPTTGLDPRSRLDLWGVIEDLVRDGTTLLLTTQYLEEADRLASRIAVIDGGTVIAEGTADQLKGQVGGSTVVVRPASARDADTVARLLEHITGSGAVTSGSGEIAAGTTGGAQVVADLAQALADVGVAVSDLALRRPTLDDVFLTLTGHTAEDAPGAGTAHPATAKELV